MKKIIFIVGIILFYISNNIAQNITPPHLQDAKRDNNWVMGLGTCDVNYLEPCSNIEINSSLVSRKSSEVLNFETLASISDTSGNLLLYTNGIQIANENYVKMVGSDTLNPGYYSSGSWGDIGYQQPQGALILPCVNQSNLYYVFHSRLKSPWESPSNYRELYYTVVDMSLNSGDGQVINLRNPIITTDSLDGRITACRHANGRDWWIMVWRISTAEYMPILVNPEGVHLTVWHQANSISNFTFNTTVGQSVFSPDGKMYAINNNYNNKNYITLYDFDRCEGLVSNPRQYMLNNMYGSAGIAFSPNSEHLYFNTAQNIYQCNTNSNTPFSQIHTIGTFDNFIEYGSPTNFFLAQMASNGKIYYSSFGGMRYLHVINNPNETGVNCSFLNRGISLLALNDLGIPNIPNFRLGSLDGSSCDTLGIDNVVATAAPVQEKQVIRAYPNPANTEITIETPFVINAVKIANSLGQNVYTVNENNKTVTISTINLPNGIYYATVYQNNGLGSSLKFIVLH